LAKIAAESVRRKAADVEYPVSVPRLPAARQLGAGPGWEISDVICTAGPNDTPFEERHSRISIAVVQSGTFQYRSSTGSELMTPGSLLLGNPGDCFSCTHEHSSGDRCTAFLYDPELFEQILSVAGCRYRRFRMPRIPPIRDLASIAAQSLALQNGDDSVAADELSLELAATAVQVASGAGSPASSRADLATLSRVSRVLRMIENEPALSHGLSSLAECAGLSPYHFLRVFQAVTGSTPHQYLLRLRLRSAALCLRTGPKTVLEIALDCGFGDISNFNRSFRSEFGMSPLAYRRGAETQR